MPGRGEVVVKLKLMTFNIRTLRANDGEHSWPNRRNLVAQVIRTSAPDIFGLQEAYPDQLHFLSTALPQYDCCGIDTSGGNEGPHNALYYLRERFHRVETGAYWLSDTPDVAGSTTWGNVQPRMVNWARFRCRMTGGSITVCNTHLHHKGEEIRMKSAQLILERLLSSSDASPLILMGDFNAEGGEAAGDESRVHAMLTENPEVGFVDAWLAADVRLGPRGTFHKFTGEADRRLDWILVRGAGVHVREVAHIDAHDGRLYPSDHFPVQASLEFVNEPSLSET